MLYLGFYMLYLGFSAFDPGCVKTLEAVASTQQEKRTCDPGESFMRERHSVRINLAPERSAGGFSRSQDPKRTRSVFFAPVERSANRAADEIQERTHLRGRYVPR
jgi:hypothetical protein